MEPMSSLPIQKSPSETTGSGSFLPGGHWPAIFWLSALRFSWAKTLHLRDPGQPIERSELVAVTRLSGMGWRRLPACVRLAGAVDDPLLETQAGSLLHPMPLKRVTPTNWLISWLAGL